MWWAACLVWLVVSFEIHLLSCCFPVCSDLGASDVLWKKACPNPSWHGVSWTNKFIIWVFEAGVSFKQVIQIHRMSCLVFVIDLGRSVRIGIAFDLSVLSLPGWLLDFASHSLFRLYYPFLSVGVNSFWWARTNALRRRSYFCNYHRLNKSVSKFRGLV